MSNLVTVSHPAAAATDLSASAGYCVKYDAGVKIATAKAIGTEDLVGIIAPGGGNTAGENCTIVVFGEMNAVADGVLTAGTHRYLTTNGSGKLIAAAAGDTVVAEWLGQQSGAGADTNIIRVLVNKFHWTLDT